MKTIVLLTILTLSLTNLAHVHNDPDETFFLNPHSPLCHKTTVTDVLSGDTFIAKIDHEATTLKLFGIKIKEGWRSHALLHSLVFKKEVFILFIEDGDSIKEDENGIPLVYVFIAHQHPIGILLELVNGSMVIEADMILEQKPSLLMRHMAVAIRIMLLVEPKGNALTTWGEIKSH